MPEDKSKIWLIRTEEIDFGAVDLIHSPRSCMLRLLGGSNIEMVKVKDPSGTVLVFDWDSLKGVRRMLRSGSGRMLKYTGVCMLLSFWFIRRCSSRTLTPLFSSRAFSSSSLSNWVKENRPGFG